MDFVFILKDDAYRHWYLVKDMPSEGEARLKLADIFGEPIEEWRVMLQGDISDVTPTGDVTVRTV